MSFVFNIILAVTFSAFVAVGVIGFFVVRSDKPFIAWLMFFIAAGVSIGVMIAMQIVSPYDSGTVSLLWLVELILLAVIPLVIVLRN